MSTSSSIPKVLSPLCSVISRTSPASPSSRNPHRSPWLPSLFQQFWSARAGGGDVDRLRKQSQVDSAPGHVYTTSSCAMKRSALNPGGASRDGHIGHRDPGAREHNLRDVSLNLRAAFICLTGVRVGQELARLRHALCRRAKALRREPLEYARQFLGQMPKPEVDRTTGSRRRSRSSRRPADATPGRPSARSPRSTTISACFSPGWPGALPPV